MVKLLHIITDTNIGGAGRLLVAQLSCIDREMFDVSVVLPRGSLLAQEIVRLGFDVLFTHHGADRSFELSAIAEYRRLIRQVSPDIVHCHGALSARLSAYFESVPVRIFTRHCTYAPSGMWRIGVLRRMAGLIGMHISTHAVAVADAAADDLSLMGVRREDISVIINGVEPLAILSPKLTQDFRHSLGFSDDDFVVGIFARLEECKGHRYLLEALSLMPRESRVRLLVCGGGRLDHELCSLTAQFGLENRVVFAGFVGDVTPYMNSCNLNVNCSVGTETSSLALSEGMSIGLPAVVSDYGGNPMMVEDGVSGVVVPRADPVVLSSVILDLESDRERLRRMGEAARKRYEEHFTASAMTRRMEEMYISQLEKAGMSDVCRIKYRPI